MPLYEYECEKDGTVIELIRPMSQADAPVKDPDGRGRSFKRRHSIFSTGQATARSGTSSLPVSSAGCCPCGKNQGSCGMGN